MEAPGIAKNILAVGATASDGSTRVRATEFAQPEGNTTIDTVAFFSSYGPTTDGRVKPEVVAPGDMVSGKTSRGCFCCCLGDEISNNVGLAC